MAASLLNSDPAPANPTPAPDATPAPATPSTPTPSPSPSGDWKTGLPEDIKDDPSLKAISDIQALAKSYVHSQRMIGADKIVVPNKYATPEDWKNVYAKLGLPESVEKYELKTKEGADPKDNFFVGFREQAHKAGILPHQAQQLYDWYDSTIADMVKNQQAAISQQAEAEVSELRQEWGQAFDMKVRAAKAVVQKFGDDNFKTYLEETGLGNNPQLIKLMAKIGESLVEDKFRGDGDAPAALTPQFAQKEINKILGDPKHPYYDNRHPGHADAVTEMQRLFSMSTGH